MTIILDRINTVPVMGYDFPFELFQWMANLVDTLNEVISDIEENLISTELTPSNVAAVNITVNTLYIPTNTVQTIYTLPATTANDIGSVVEISGLGSGGWKLLTAAGQTIKVASVNASANTSITSAHQYDSIKIILIDANTWNTLTSETTGFTIV